jgi:hypothetical protein
MKVTQNTWLQVIHSSQKLLATPSTLNLLLRVFQDFDWIPLISHNAQPLPFFSLAHIIRTHHPNREFPSMKMRVICFSSTYKKVMRLFIRHREGYDVAFQTSKQKVVSGNQLKYTGYQGYETFHPPT